MGIDDNIENWNKENFKTTLKKKVNFEAGNGASKFEPLPKQYSFKLIATCSPSELASENPDDPWTKFKKKFIYDDENLSDSDIFNELLELCSWYDPKDDGDRDPYDDDDSDEDIEMIKRNLNSEMKYSSPSQRPSSSSANTQGKPSLKLRQTSSSCLSLSTLRLSSSANLVSKRRQMDESNNSLCPTNKRAFTPFQLRRTSSMNLDEAISCAAQNLDVDIPAMFVVSTPPSAPPTLERQNSDFWNELDSVTF